MPCDETRQRRGALLMLATSLYTIAWITVGNYGNEVQIFEPPLRFVQAEIHSAKPPVDPQLATKEGVVHAFLRQAAEVELVLFRVRRTDWTFLGIQFFVAAAVLLLVLYFKFDDYRLDDDARPGWGVLLFFLQVALFLGVDAAAAASISLPLVLWGGAYLTVLAAATRTTQIASLLEMDS
jgi:hypothetical protein